MRDNHKKVYGLLIVSAVCWIVTALIAGIAVRLAVGNFGADFMECESFVSLAAAAELGLIFLQYEIGTPPAN